MAKLIFFIHGVAVRNSDYGEPLPRLIKKALNERNQESPYIHKGFWGNWSGGSDAVSSHIDHPSLKYQEARRGPLSRFMGDSLNYMNDDTGQQIRKMICDQIKQALKTYSNVREIYFVTQSFGTVILWDVLFSKRFKPSDPAWDIQTILSKHISLQGIVTMGSPVAFINMTFGTTPTDIRDNLCNYTRLGQPIIWLNFVHASDLIAYPLSPLLQGVDSRLITFEDVFTGNFNYSKQSIENFVKSNNLQFLISKNDDLKDATEILTDIFSQSSGQLNYFENSVIFRESLSLLPGIVSTPTAHMSYYKDPTVARRIAIMMHPYNASEIAQNTLNNVIARLNQVPGMTKIKSDFRRKVSQQLDFTDEVVNRFDLKDHCGSITLTKNLVQVHHVLVADRSGVTQFFGYVGLIHGQGLCNAVGKIQSEFGMR
jgi:hypothetical protein